MSLSNYHREKILKLSKYERRRYAQDYVADVIRSCNYWLFAGNSWNLKNRNTGMMERFTNKLLGIITDAIHTDTPEEELFRLFDALFNAISRLKHYKMSNL